jgi:regulation of enolase protein 1 (concanavalin A-like superfamily)
MTAITLRPLPFELQWRTPPEDWGDTNDLLTVDAGPRTDWFVDPTGAAAPIMNAPALLGHVTGDFVLAARVDVAFRSTFDAGCLVVHADDESWAKLCFERSPDAGPMVVSVVTRGASDDCNSTVVEGDSIWLRVARLGPAFAFHASIDGARWQLVRQFALAVGDSPTVGFLSQSPLGTGCRASFDEISFEARRLQDLRDGQ